MIHVIFQLLKSRILPVTPNPETWQWFNKNEPARRAGSAMGVGVHPHREISHVLSFRTKTCVDYTRLLGNLQDINIALMGLVGMDK